MGCRIIEKITSVVGIPPSGAVGELPQANSCVVGEPEDEPIERLIEKIIVVEELFQLLVFDAIRGVGSDDAVAKKHGDRRIAVEGSEEIQVAVGQLELETIDGEPLVLDASGWREIALNNGRVQRWRSQAGTGTLTLGCDRVDQDTQGNQRHAGGSPTW
jgi:hypothetical protein